MTGQLLNRPGRYQPSQRESRTCAGRRGADPKREVRSLLRSELDTAATTRGDILGQGEGTGASYTIAAVVRLLASNANGLTSGKTNFSKPMLVGDVGSYVRIGTIHSTAKIGVHLDGVGAWGFLWIVFDYTSGTTGTLSVRINGADLATETVRVSRGSLGVDTTATIGASGGGSEVAAFRLAEMLVYPGQAFDSAQLASKETYFAARYPSLAL